MNVTLIFANVKIYNENYIDRLRIYRSNITKWINMILDSGSTIQYLLEDSTAHSIINELGIKDCNVVTLINEEDLECTKRLEEAIKYDDYVYDLYHLASYKDMGSRDKYKLPNIVKYSDKSKWRLDRLDCINKRNKYALKEYIQKNRAVIVFYDSATSGNYVSPEDSHSLGDGKLYIEVNLNDGISYRYYGGVWVDEDMIKVILSMGGN